MVHLHVHPSEGGGASKSANDYSYQARKNQYVCLTLEQVLYTNHTLEVLHLEDLGIN